MIHSDEDSDGGTSGGTGGASSEDGEHEVNIPQETGGGETEVPANKAALTRTKFYSHNTVVTKRSGFRHSVLQTNVNLYEGCVHFALRCTVAHRLTDRAHACFAATLRSSLRWVCGSGDIS